MKSFTAGKKRGRSTALAVCRKRHLRQADIGAPLYKGFRNKRQSRSIGKKGAPDTRLCPGDLVELYINDEFFSAAPPTARPLPYKKRPPLRMVYEDENIAALYKPAHLLQPFRPHG